MTWTSALAIYFLFWFFSVFLVLPFGVRTAEEAGVELVPGQAESAPHKFEMGKTALRVTIVGTTLWALFLANYNYGWITVEMLDWAR